MLHSTETAIVCFTVIVSLLAVKGDCYMLQLQINCYTVTMLQLCIITALVLAFYTVRLLQLHYSHNINGYSYYVTDIIIALTYYLLHCYIATATILTVTMLQLCTIIAL